MLIELERRRWDVHYVRTPEGHEVEFLARAPDGETHLIQVCADPGEPRTLERELHALAEGREGGKKARRWLLTLTAMPAPAMLPADIEFKPAYAWMLDPAIAR